MELKPGEIVFFPPWKQSLSENPASPHPLPLSLPHPLLSISSSEGSEVITKPRWRALPCLRPQSFRGSLVPTHLTWSLGHPRGCALPTKEWPLGPMPEAIAGSHLVNRMISHLSHGVNFHAPPHQRLTVLLGNVTFLPSLCKS